MLALGNLSIAIIVLSNQTILSFVRFPQQNGRKKRSFKRVIFMYSYSYILEEEEEEKQISFSYCVEIS